MGIVAVTNFVYGDGEFRTIVLPPLREWERIDASSARAKGADRIAPPDYEERIQRFLNGESINLAGEGRLRVGCSMGLLVNGQLVFGSFDMGHPSRPGYLTPPAGGFEGDCSPLGTASTELAEEFILLDKNNTVGLWHTPDRVVYVYQATAYARDHGLQLDYNLTVPIELLYDFPNVTTVIIGNIRYKCLVEFEPDTSSIELIFVGEVELPDGVKIVDGERLPNGNWRNTPVVTWTPNCTATLGTKAEILVKTFGPKN